MGGFLKGIAKLGATGAATAAGGPIAGAAMAGGLNAISSLAKGGNLRDMLTGAATGAGGAWLGGQLATPNIVPVQPTMIGAAPISAVPQPSLYETLSGLPLSSKQY